MLQFNKSETTNTNAVWIQTPNTSSDYYDTLQLVYSQSYDRSNGKFDLVTYSAPNQYRNWLVITNSGSLVPIPSGQYNIEIFTSALSPIATWGGTDQVWATTDQVWETFNGELVLGDLIYSDRAFISGSNEVSITQYVSPDENGTYTTYNG